MATTTWADIPPEIVDKILGYCDKPSLVVLSQVNQQLHFSAFSRYFAHQIIGDLIQLPPKSSLGGHENEFPPIHILRTAVWLPKTIRHIDYYPPSHVNCNRYFNDLGHLTAFITKMPKLISLRVNSGRVIHDQLVDEQPRHDIWNRLLVVAILKGCQILEVTEFGVFHHRRSKPSDRQLEPHLFRIFRPPSTSKSRGSSSLLSLDRWFPEKVRSSLQEIHIQGIWLENSPLMFGAILARHSASLTRLFLKNIVMAWPEELKIFDRLHFPVLQSFTFSQYWMRFKPSTSFPKFLSRHPTLTHLDLGISFWDDPSHSLLEWSFWRQPPTFPKLQHLGVFPDTLAWLVPDFRRCPNLRSFALRKGGTGIHRLQRILNDLHGLTSVAPLTIEMRVPLGDSNWLLRMCAPVDDGGPPPYYPRVKELKLVDTSSNPRLELDTLINWLSMCFPSLECLEIEATPDVFGDEFVKSLAIMCRKLRSFKLPFGPIHPRLGQERKVWEVQDGRVRSRIIPHVSTHIPPQ